MHFLYKITNTINPNLYIGQTNDLVQRWAQYKSAVKHENESMVIYRAMIKHKIENFTLEHIASCATLDDANYLEILLIEQYESHTSTGKGYNVSLGGNSPAKTPEVCAAISAGLQKYYETHEGWAIGYKHTPESKLKMSESAMGKPGTNTGKTFPEEWRNNISAAMIGIEHPKAHRFNEEEESSICNEYVSGKSIDKLGAALGCHKSVILAILTRRGVPRRTRHEAQPGMFSQDIQQQICNTYQTGKNMIELGKQFNCTRTTIKNVLVRNQIEIRKNPGNKGKPMLGKHHTEEAKSALSKAHKGKTWKLIDGKRIWLSKE